MEETDATRSLTTLVHDIHLQASYVLVMAGPTGLIPDAIAEQLEVSGAMLSFRLRKLTAARLMTQERDGHDLIYRATHDHMSALLGLLADSCCQGNACLSARTDCRYRPLPPLPTPPTSWSSAPTTPYAAC